LKLKDDGAIKVDVVRHTLATAKSGGMRTIQSSLKNMSSSHANLDAASTDRKARLAKLAALKRKQPEQVTDVIGRKSQAPPLL
jgi:hypothetical protein